VVQPDQHSDRLFLLFLTGVGPLLSWRRASSEGLRRNFQWPFVGMVVLMGGLFAAGIHHVYALMTFGLCLFVTMTIVQEFYKGAAIIGKKESTNVGFIKATIELTHRNTRRYGGYLVHMGVVIMCIGFAGAAFNKDSTTEVEQGKSFQLGRYDLKVTGVNSGQTDNYVWQSATVEATVDGKPYATLQPGAADLFAEPAAGGRGGDSPQAARGFVHQLRGDVERGAEADYSDLHFPVGIVDLGWVSGYC
jgi:cytochrome c-type biogenesis protein CcmF